MSRWIRRKVKVSGYVFDSIAALYYKLHKKNPKQRRIIYRFSRMAKKQRSNNQCNQ